MSPTPAGFDARRTDNRRLPTLAVSQLVLRTSTEEEKLVARFGGDYRAYVERTGRFLPKIRANR